MSAGRATFLVVNAWRSAGIGHSIYHSALWLTLARHLQGRVRFAFCLPEGVPDPLVGKWVRRPKSSLLPNCSAPGTFDLHEHLSRSGTDLRATAAHFDAASLTLRKPSCDTLVAVASKQQGVTALVVEGVQPEAAAGLSGLEGCIGRLWPAAVPRNSLNQSWFDQQAVVGELRKLDLRPKRPLLPCRVGLHLRTMAVDQPGCNNLVNASSCEVQGSRRPPQRRCAQLSRLVGPTPPGVCALGPRYVTSDDPAMYERFDAWNNSGERAVHTQNSHHQGVEAFKAEAKKTVAAWLTLASCTVAIVAPVASAFSTLAQLRAGVRLEPCCTAARSSGLS